MESTASSSWMKRDVSEIEALIVKLANQGLTSEKIGMVLRDTYGIPKTKVLGIKISRVIKKKEIKYEPQDLKNLRINLEKLKKHSETNKQDKVAKLSLQSTQNSINKLLKYHKKKGADN